MNKIELAWAGGYFEGEGNFSVHKREGSYYDTAIQVSSVDRVSLERLQKAIGGAIYGAYKRKHGHKPVWVWNVCASEQESVAKSLLPYLEAKKKRGELLIEARQIIARRRGKHEGNQYKGIKYPPYPKRIEEILVEMRLLNKRGTK